MKLKYWFTPGGLAYQFRNGFLTREIAHSYFCKYIGGDLDDYLLWQIYGKKSFQNTDPVEKPTYKRKFIFCKIIKIK